MKEDPSRLEQMAYGRRDLGESQGLTREEAVRSFRAFKCLILLLSPFHCCHAAMVTITLVVSKRRCSLVGRD